MRHQAREEEGKMPDWVQFIIIHVVIFAGVGLYCLGWCHGKDYGRR